MRYDPKPIDTDQVNLTPDILALTERLAENAHDNWGRQRSQDGWTWGPARDDAAKKHPCLLPYAELAEPDKELDRIAALQTLKAIIALGYRISKIDPRPTHP